MSNVRGFTLAEMLVVIAIVAIVGTILVTIFNNTLLGSNKSQILSAIKQNGQSVLENMDKTIRNADNLVCVSESPNNTIVVVQKGVYTRYRIVLPAGTTGTAPPSCIGGEKNGCIVWDNPIPQVTETTPLPFINRVCNPTDPMLLAQILTDTNPQSGVLLESGSFTLSKLAGFKDAVTIEFRLKPAARAPYAIAGQIDPVEFKTTIGLR